MKQIDIIKTYAQKRCMVVEDMPDVRTSLKRILVDYGANAVDTAASAEDAIELCSKQNYDIVLADYNLGSGKNGQQLLEELRYQALLKNTAIYVMITAETASDFVLHALEYQPDDYLNKPISRDSLRPRLDQALLKNEALLPIKQALDSRAPSKAIAACQSMLEKPSKAQGKYLNDVCKLLGHLFLAEKKFENAETLYHGIEKDRPLLWASLGKARAQFGLGKFKQAQEELLALVREHPMCVEAHDLLANCYESLNDIGNAQHSLENAVKLSPNSAPRQRELGRLSAENGNPKAAVHAYRKALKQSKNSCHESPEDFLSLADSLHAMSKQESGSDRVKLLGEAMETLRVLDKRHGNQPLAKVHSKLLEASIHEAQGDTEGAQRAAREAMEKHQSIRSDVVAKSPATLAVECAKALMAYGDYDKGEHMLQAFAEANEDRSVAHKIDKLLREPRTKEGVQYAATLNKRGIDHYRNKDLEQAILAFEDVLNELPNHIGLNLNLIQAMLGKSKQKPLSERELARIETCFKRIGKVKPGSEYLERYQYLVKRYQHIIGKGDDTQAMTS